MGTEVNKGATDFRDATLDGLQVHGDYKKSKLQYHITAVTHFLSYSLMADVS